MRSLIRIKRYHDMVAIQAAEVARLNAGLAELNAGLEARVASQVSELERLGRLRRFLSPQIAQLVVDSGDESFLHSHRREITTVFTDLRGFTSFAETSEPEETMAVLADYHRVLGERVFAYGGTLEHFAGDGLMVFFNDPVPCPDAPARAVRMALDMRERVRELSAAWQTQGHALGFGVGIAQGFATLGRIGFEGRDDYGAIGTVTNLAARLCSEAGDGQVLVSQRVLAGVGDGVVSRPLGALTLRGLSRPVEVLDVVRLSHSGEGR